MVDIFYIFRFGRFRYGVTKLRMETVISAKRLEELLKSLEPDGWCSRAPNLCDCSVSHYQQLKTGLEASLRVVEAAKECVGELGLNSSMEELEKALIPFTEEPKGTARARRRKKMSKTEKCESCKNFDPVFACACGYSDLCHCDRNIEVIDDSANAKEEHCGFCGKIRE